MADTWAILTDESTPEPIGYGQAPDRFHPWYDPDATLLENIERARRWRSANEDRDPLEHAREYDEDRRLRRPLRPRSNAESRGA